MCEQARNLSDLLKTLRSHLPMVEDRYHIETLEVFGSFARAEERKISDLDLLVTFSELPGLLTFIALENELSDILGVKVDLVLKDALKPAIGERIIQEAIRV